MGSVKIVHVTASEQGGVVKDPAYRQNDFLFFGNLSLKRIFCIGWFWAVNKKKIFLNKSNENYWAHQNFQSAQYSFINFGITICPKRFTYVLTS